MDGHLRVTAVAAGVGGSSGNSAAVREESHLEDMRSAIRGDFARLAERRGDQDLMRVEPETEGSEAEPTIEHVEEPAPTRSWLARFVSP